MKVTQVSLRPSEDAARAGSPTLTPELLAACGARYSRNNEGLFEILARIDPDNLDKSVDSIFRLIDYGHQSIADMVPLAMFIDGVSLWLAYYLWTLSPTAGGQESSTRYIRLAPESLISADTLGIPAGLRPEWQSVMEQSLAAYGDALAAWDALSAENPSLTRIPAEILQDTSEKNLKRIDRMRRNYSFDRARYYLPLACSTNVMLLMSARAWVTLCQHLCSHPLPEARQCGEAVQRELALSSPRLMRHAAAKESVRQGQAAAFDALQAAARNGLPPPLHPGAPVTDIEPRAHLEVFPPQDARPGDMAGSLRFHDNRYAWIGQSLQRTAVRFSWEAVTFGEIRDLNRHRTGTRYCELRPLGFYAALDQLPASPAPACATLRSLNATGRIACARAHEQLASGDAAYMYWLPLGAQCYFEHTTTADKFIYEAELRTGVGAHYLYARHLRDALALWYERFPETRGLVLEGTAEPE